MDLSTYLSRILEKSYFHNVIVLPHCIPIIQQICCVKVSFTVGSMDIDIIQYFQYWTSSNI